MLIERLQIQNVRILANITLEPGAKLNFITGPNASGKTSLLEAIYILSRGRSFRTSKVNDVLRHNQGSLLVSAMVKNDQGKQTRTGIEKSNTRTNIRYNGEVIGKISIQATNLPLILITPDSATLVTGIPKQRRHWLDWAMFHVEPLYLEQWRNYHRSLRQRNTLIRKGIREEGQFVGWENAMQQEADAVTLQRKRFIDQIQDQISSILVSLDLPATRISYLQGWPGDQTLAQYLKSGREIDAKTGFTRYGIHRADIEFIRDGKPISKVCSRGEIKQFVTILLIAQAMVYKQCLTEKPLVLIDDISSELDTNARNRIIALLKDLDAQVFLTLTSAASGCSASEHETMFHVEQGLIGKVVK
jgi:DNA replication and repair protein RecF